MTDMFLTKEEMAILTGRRSKAKQIEALRTMQLPFWINAVGYPVMARSTIEGRKDAEPPRKKKWVMPD